MAGIFISYRQADAKAWAINLRDDLAKAFGDGQVFLDKDALGPGNWRDQLQGALERCSVVIVVIGKHWLTISDERNRSRISLHDDVHHQEIALALGHKGVTVIPVLVDEAAMPKAEQLPEDIRGLTNQQAYKVGDTKARRKTDLEELVKGIAAISGLFARPVDSEDQPAWYKLDYTAVGMAFVLTVLVCIMENASDTCTPEVIPVLLVTFYGAALGGKWLWQRIRNRKRRIA